MASFIMPRKGKIMFWYVLRLLLAAYFIKYYCGLLKPKTFRTLFVSQSAYITGLKQTMIETKQKWENARFDTWKESGVMINVSFEMITKIMSFFQLVMIVASALLIRDFAYLLFVCLFAGIHLIEHFIMSCFYQEKETNFMMWCDRLIFVFNYVAYGMVIMALILL